MSAASAMLSAAIRLMILTSSLLLGVCILRSVLLFPAPSTPASCSSSTSSHVRIDESTRVGVISRFSSAIRFRTITRGARSYDADQLMKLTAFLRNAFPRLHESAFVTVETFANHSLLYTIRGSDESLAPYLLASHLDVVPVEQDKWTVPAFDGLVKDGNIYGRGTLDVKDTLMGIMESLEFLMESGFTPRRSLFLALGHDEEGSGFEGAQEMAKILTKRLSGQELLYILDEGTFILKPGSFPGIRQSVAMIGVSEKGYVTVKLTVRADAGHSSMSPRETAIVKLAKVISRFTSDAHPSRFTEGPEKGLFESLACHAAYPFKLVYANLWLFRIPISLIFSRMPMPNALIRTTSAVTVIQGGMKENVIPSEVTALINHRIHPSDTIHSVMETDRRIIDDDSIEMSQIDGHVGFEPHPVSPFDKESFGYNVIGRSVRENFEDTIVVPGIMVASTDTKWYLNLTRSIYRFSPAHLSQSDAKLFHGHDEHISVDNYIRVINFYHHLILSSDRSSLHDPNLVKDEL